MARRKKAAVPTGQGGRIHVEASADAEKLDGHVFPPQHAKTIADFVNSDVNLVPIMTPLEIFLVFYGLSFTCESPGIDHDTKAVFADVRDRIGGIVADVEPGMLPVMEYLDTYFRRQAERAHR